MPAIAVRRSVLEGRAEVVAYARNPSAFFLRLYVPEKRSYKTRLIEGATSLEAACAASLDVYIAIGAGAAPQKRGTKTGTKLRPANQDLMVWLDRYLLQEQERLEAGLIKASTLKNKQETLLKHFKAYCHQSALVKTTDLKVGCFDRYEIFRSQATALTRRKELSIISSFVDYLIKHRLLDPHEAAQKSLVPKVRLKDADFDSNPPFRDEEEWRTILKHIRRWVKEAESHPNPRTLHWRRMFWSLLLLLRNSGMRPAEARQLRWKDLEFENVGRISQRQRDLDLGALQLQGIDEIELTDYERESLGRVDRYVVHIRVLQSKTGAMREVTCNAAEALARWRKWQRQYLADREDELRCIGLAAIKGSDGLPVIPDETLVFALPDKAGWKLPPYNTINVCWRDIINRASPELKGPQLSEHPYTIYSCRSSRAQELMDLGVDVYLAATQLGHSVAVLEKIYARLPQRKRATQEAAVIHFGKRQQETEIVSVDHI